MAPRRALVPRGEHPAIVTRHLPERCPACGSVQIVVGRPYADGDRQVTRVSCGGQYGSCTFSEKYALEAR